MLCYYKDKHNSKIEGFMIISYKFLNKTVHLILPSLPNGSELTL